MVSPRRLAFALRLCFLASAVLLADDARAAVNQPPPGNEPMPVPTGMNEYSIWVARGFPMDAGTLAGLFKYHAINGVAGGDITIDPVRDAHTTPGAFSPQCGLQRHHRAARRRLQERARLVQHDRERDDAASRQPDLPAGAGQPDGGAAQRPDVHGRRFLSAGHAHHDAGRAAHVGRLRFRLQHPHGHALGRRADRPGDDRRAAAASARRRNTRRRSSTTSRRRACPGSRR